LNSNDAYFGIEMHEVANTTLHAEADSSGANIGAGGRTVLHPFDDRTDVGSFGLYEGNWGGARKDRMLQDRLRHDLIEDCRFSVITAQEVDKMFAQELSNSTVGGGWIIVAGDEDKSLLIGARASLVKEVKLLEFHRIVDGDYKVGTNKTHPTKATAYSRLLLAQVVWKKPMANQASHIFLTCHMHYQTAKRAQGFCRANDDFWKKVVAITQAYDVDFITGDFNMSLWQVCIQLRETSPGTTMLAWYGWKSSSGGSYLSAGHNDGEEGHEHVDGATSSVVTGKGPLDGSTLSHRSDSCGIFSLRKPGRITRAMPDDAFENPDAVLDEWVKGQGYAITSYLGKGEAVKASLQTPGGPVGMLRTKEKKTERAKFDPDGLLFRSGAHKPLLVFVGALSRRSTQAMQRREAKMTGRGWGVDSWQRAMFMQMNGHGPRPGDAKGKDDANKGMAKGGSTHGRGKGPGTYEEQGKGHQEKREKGKGYKGTGNHYEGKGNHGVQQGKDRDSRGAKGEHQHQWNSEKWVTCEPHITHGRGDANLGDVASGWKHHSEFRWSDPYSGWQS
jgi:hypothetical protein